MQHILATQRCGEAIKVRKKAFTRDHNNIIILIRLSLRTIIILLLLSYKAVRGP